MPEFDAGPDAGPMSSPSHSHSRPAKAAKSVIWLRALALWGLIVAAEACTGVIRQLFAVPAIGDMPARQLGVAIGAVIIFAIARAGIGWIRARSFGRQVGVGLLWVVLIVAFELTLGAMLGYSRERLLSDYDIKDGGYLGLGLLFMLFAPALAGRTRGIGGRSTGVGGATDP